MPATTGSSSIITAAAIVSNSPSSKGVMPIDSTAKLVKTVL